MFSKEKIIILDKKIESKDELFRIIADKAFELKISNDSDATFEAFQNREAQGTTGFLEGFGIPHGKTDANLEPNVIFVRSNVPIEWDSMDGEPLTEMFALMIPEKGSAEHLKILTQISRKLMDKDFRNNIKAAKTNDAILKLLKKI